MYGDPNRQTFTVGQLELAGLCPASYGKGSTLPRAVLDRWSAVAAAARDLLAGRDLTETIDAQLGWLDPVQRAVAEGQVRRWARLVADLVPDMAADGETPDGVDGDVTVDLDPPALEVDLPGLTDVGVRASPTVTVEHADGSVEVLKIRTGRTGTGRAEAAVLLAALAEAGLSDVSVVDVLLEGGAVEPVALDQAQIAAELDRLAAVARRLREGGRPARTPGWHCYRCNRVARCGQYPAGPGTRVTNRTRTIRLSKGDLLSACGRAIAWRRLFSLPSSVDAEERIERGRGIAFHDIIGPTLLSDDPARVFEDGLAAVEPSEHAPLRDLFARHRELEASHEPVEYRRVEYEIGITEIVPGIDVDRRDRVVEAPVAVTVIARADALGREADGTPAVVEHRTGTTGREVDPLEVDLYALSAARLTGEERAVVHVHVLGGEDGPTCVRFAYGPSELVEAVARLREALTPVARWHPHDAATIKARPGRWCLTCELRARCDAAIAG